MLSDIDIDRYIDIFQVIDNDLKFDPDCEAIRKKGQQCLHCLRKLNVFNVDKKMM